MGPEAGSDPTRGRQGNLLWVQGPWWGLPFVRNARRGRLLSPVPHRAPKGGRALPTHPQNMQGASRNRPGLQAPLRPGAPQLTGNGAGTARDGVKGEMSSPCIIPRVFSPWHPREVPANEVLERMAWGELMAGCSSGARAKPRWGGSSGAKPKPSQGCFPPAKADLMGMLPSRNSKSKVSVFPWCKSRAELRMLPWCKRETKRGMLHAWRSKAGDGNASLVQKLSSHSEDPMVEKEKELGMCKSKTKTGVLPWCKNK